MLFALACAGCEPDVIRPSPDYDFQWYLPNAVKESSGLAMHGNMLLLHDDETAMIYSVSKDMSSVTERVQLGDPIMEEDLEGIAVNGDTIYVMNSEGHVFVAEDALTETGTPAIASNVIRYDSELGQHCELEGLAYYNDLLLLPCKLPRSDSFKDQLTVFSFDLKTGISEEFFRILIDSGSDGFALTAITYQGDDFYILAARYLIIVNPVTSISQIIPLSRALHRQPEGIEITPEGSIYIVDDYRKGIGRITYYPELQALISANAPG